MLELSNCDHCGEVFAKGIRDICPSCHKLEEADFKTVYHFLMKRQNREATLPEIVEATGVEKDLIVKFIKQNRLRTSQFPMLAYDCEKCGADITKGRICEKCSSDINAEMASIEEVEQRKQQRETDDAEKQTFFAQNKLFKK